VHSVQKEYQSNKISYITQTHTAGIPALSTDATTLSAADNLVRMKYRSQEYNQTGHQLHLVG
jgi:hypothetical protein